MGGECSKHGKMLQEYKVLVGKLKGRYYSEDLAIDRMITLEWVLGKCGLDSSGSGNRGSSCEHGNKHLSSI